MTEIWIALLLYTSSPKVQILSEFPSERVCWENYSGDQTFGTQLKDHQDKPITKDYHFKRMGAEYPVRLFVVPETKELLWLTCELRASLDWPNTRKYPLNFLLPTPA